MERTELAATVTAAAQGDKDAWEQLVARFGGLLWAIARSHRLNQSDAADVVQSTWLKLLEHFGDLRSPEAVGAWLATTARRECLAVLRSRDRERPSDLETDGEGAAQQAPEDSPELSALRSERAALLRASLDEVSPRCQRLLRVLAASPPPSYAEVATALSMPIGSIGPTRARCLECLRRHSERLGMTSAALAG